MSDQSHVESPFNQWGHNWSKANLLAKKREITLEMMLGSVAEKAGHYPGDMDFRIEPCAKWYTDPEDKKVLPEWRKPARTENPRFLPIAFRWAQNEPKLFLEQDFSHDTFLNHCLNHSKLAVPMHVALVDHSKVFEVWSLERRISFLEKWAPEYAHRTGYTWPKVMDEWCPDSTRVLLFELLEKPEHASQFLCGEYAYFGWNALKTVKETLEFFSLAARIAPYEVFRALHLIELRFGDILTGGDLIEHENFHYVFDSEEPTKSLREKGCELAKQVLAVADARLCELYKQEESVSVASRNFAYRMRHFRKDYEIKAIPQLSGLLLDLADSRIGRKLLAVLTDRMTSEKAPGLYRWMLAEHEHHPRHYIKDKRVKASWFHPRLRAEVIKHGWRFTMAREHKNPKRQNRKDVQVVLQKRSPKVILKHRFGGRDDYISTAREVIIPQDSNACGSVVFDNSYIQIRTMEMHPAEAPSYTMELWSLYL